MSLKPHRVAGSGLLRVHVDRERCQGHARCVAVASELFQLDAFGNAHEISDGIVPPDLEVKVRPCRPLTTPMGLCRDAGVLIPTYCNDTVMRMPPDVDPAIDRQRIRETGRRLADGYLRDSPLLASNVTSEPAAGDGFTAKEALETSREFATNFPGAH